MKQLFIFAYYLVALASSATFTRAPTFSLLEERLDNGTPSVAITFPDGYTDTLVLNHYYSDEEDINVQAGCHFLGHLANDHDACVAMTGCIGQEDVEFTIMSEHASDSGLYKWNKDGTIEIINHPLTNGAQDRVLDTVLLGAADDRWSGHSPHANSGRRKENPDPEDGVDEIEFAEFYIGKMMSSSQLNNLPANQKMVVKVAYDDSYLKKLGSITAIKSHYKAVHVHLQATFCHSSFGVKIKLELSGDSPIHIKGKTITASEDGMKALFDTTYKTIAMPHHKADHVIYLVHDKRTCESNPSCTCGGGFFSRNCGTIEGISPIAQVCLPRDDIVGMRFSNNAIVKAKADSFKMSINEWQSNKNAFGTLIAHEVAHNLGIRHDFDKVHGGNGSKGSGKSCENDKNFMSYGDKGQQQQWSACSRKDFAAHYLMITKGGIDWCLDTLKSDACSGTEKPKPPASTPAKPKPPAPTPATKPKRPTCIMPPCSDNPGKKPKPPATKPKRPASTPAPSPPTCLMPPCTDYDY